MLQKYSLFFKIQVWRWKLLKRPYWFKSTFWHLYMALCLEKLVFLPFLTLQIIVRLVIEFPYATIYFNPVIPKISK